MGNVLVGSVHGDGIHSDREGILRPSDSAFPTVLRQLYRPPTQLYWRGDLTCLSQPCVAIVGSRKATDYGRRIAHRLAFELADKGVTVVSGLAYGVDKAAHEGALDAGGKTIAVFGTGIDRVYPARHRALVGTIEKNGLVLSEFDPGTPPLRYHFPKRNRLISGLSCAVVVVQAFEGGGSLITADFAQQQGREVFIVPGHMDDPSTAGSNQAIRDHVGQILCSSEQLIQWLMDQRHLPTNESDSPALGIRPERKPTESTTAGLSKPLMQLCQLILEGVSTASLLSQRATFLGADLWTHLMELELDGVLRVYSGHRYELTQKGRLLVLDSIRENQKKKQPVDPT